MKGTWSARRGRFTRAHAIGLIWTGWSIVGSMVVGAVIIGMTSAVSALGRALVAVGIPEDISVALASAMVFAAGAAGGVGLGTPFIVAGEILLVGLDQRCLLVEQGRLLRKLRRDLAPRPQPRSVADRGATSLVNRLSPR